jgi:ribosome recycling factor
MNVAEIKKNAEQRMQKTLESLKTELGKIRTGRAHPGILDHVLVDYYGSPTPVPKVANVAVLDARTLGVSPWEKKLAGAIEKAIRDSGLGLNPAAQGDTIRVPMPALTEERRKEMIKIVKSEGEGARVAIRNHRRDANNAAKDLLKAKTISEDQDRRSQDEVQKLTDRFIAEVEKILGAKESELLSI